MVDRYTEWADWAGWADEWADRRPAVWTDWADGNHNLAKVRVAGSNPVVRSISGLLSGHFLMAASHSQSHLTIPSRCRESPPSQSSLSPADSSGVERPPETAGSRGLVRLGFAPVRERTAWR